MAQGKVKWFNAKKGFGFIESPDVDGDIFVHFSEIQSDGFRTLKDGEVVKFELVNDGKGFKAIGVLRHGD